MVLPHKASLVFGLFLCAVGGPVSAQMVQPLPGVTASDPVNTLSIHLRTLSANPRNLFALLGAGQAAIDVGDPNAALGFFARAEEIDPRSARAKAGLASALVLLEKPDDALRVFGEAVSLGIAESEIAKDRGLAHDLRGENRAAQRDYVLALKRGSDDETTRRYALSLGISGERSQALTVLDPLLRKQDQGAWRARAFILAMNNDVAGANIIARQVMPASLASTMSPFLVRLSKLSPADSAHAVNFGTMPADGQTFASVQIDAPFRPVGGAPASANAGDGLIPFGVPLGKPPSAPQSAQVGPPREQPLAKPIVIAAAPKVTPGFTTNPSQRVNARLETRLAAVDPAKLPPEARGEVAIPPKPIAVTVMPPPDNARPPVSVAATPRVEPVIAAPPPVQVADATPTTTTSPLPPAPVAEPDAGLPQAEAGLVGPPAEPVGGASVPFEVKPATAPVPEVSVPAALPVSRLAAIMSSIEPEAESAPVALPTTAEIRAAQRAAARKATAASAAAAAAQLVKDEKAKAAAAAKANPPRLWVQVATGGNVRGLSTTWRKIRDANDELLKPYGGYSVPFRATNRVLAGPVRSTADARALVTALGAAGVAATTYSSEAGQEVEKLSAK